MLRPGRVHVTGGDGRVTADRLRAVDRDTPRRAVTVVSGRAPGWRSRRALKGDRLIRPRQLRALVHDLLSVNSANPATFPGGPGERNVARYCRRWLTVAGVPARLLYPNPATRRPAVLARVGPGGGRTVLLVGHLDTYLWYPGPYPCRDGVLRGPGATDMKGGVAAILAVLARAARGLRAGTLAALLVPDEEHASTGMRALAPALRWDAAVVVEDTGLRLGTAHPGRVTGYLSTGSPAERRACLAGLMEHAHRLRRTRPAEPGRLTQAQDPSAPDRFVIRRRVAPDEVAHEVLTDLRDALPAAVAGRGGWTVRESFQADPTDRWAGSLVAAGRRHALPMTATTLTGWTEAAVLAVHGRPCLVFGPGGGGAHSATEWVDLRQVEIAAEVLYDAATSYCQPS